MVPVLERWQKLTGRRHPLAKRLASDPCYRLQTYREVQLAADLGFTIDVNRATVDDWLRLPGVSIRQAQQLQQLRGSGVQFYCIEDIAAALGISVAHLQPLARVLAFCHYDQAGGLAPQPLSVNLADPGQLCRIPGVTPQMAQLIVRDRGQRGPFQNIADLQKRLAMPADLVQALMHYLST
jgi:DNA uptake protein ComE-like DNA-binding protein